MTKEGMIFPLPFIAIAAGFYFIFNQYQSMMWLYLSALSFYIGLAMMLFFRDPDRKAPKGDDLIISPADGKVIYICEDSSRPSISIFLGVHNVHVNRSPVKGVVKSVVFYPGKFLVASHGKAMTENQRNEIEIETSKGMVKMNQVSGFIARRTIFYKKPGVAVTAGERVGLIRFGSRVDLFLPAGSTITVNLKQKVVAGETILGNLP